MYLYIISISYILFIAIAFSEFLYRSRIILIRMSLYNVIYTASLFILIFFPGNIKYYHFSNLNILFLLMVSMIVISLWILMESEGNRCYTIYPWKTVKNDADEVEQLIKKILYENEILENNFEIRQTNRSYKIIFNNISKIKKIKVLKSFRSVASCNCSQIKKYYWFEFFATVIAGGVFYYYLFMTKH